MWHFRRHALHAKVVTKVVDPISTRSHCSRSSIYDHCIPPFIDVDAEECIEHVKDKEEGLDDDRGSYRASMHGFTLTTLNVLITLWALICVSDSRGVDSSYHVRTTVNVERGTFGGITIHNKYKGG